MADHPIIISGGSPLRIQHDSWHPQDDHTLGTGVHANTVTRVEVISDAGALPTIFFKGEQLELQLTYGDIHLNVSTDKNGQKPVVQFDGETSLKKHFRQKDAHTHESVKDDGSVQDLALRQGGVDQPLGALSGHTEIVIHYE